MNKKEFKQEIKKIKKILTSRKTKKIVKSHFIFWDKALNGLGDSIANNLILPQEETQPIITVNEYYLL